MVDKELLNQVENVTNNLKKYIKEYQEQIKDVKSPRKILKYQKKVMGFYQKLLEINEQANEGEGLGPRDIQITEYSTKLGDLAVKAGQLKKAEDSYQKALSQGKRSLSPKNQEKLREKIDWTVAVQGKSGGLEKTFSIIGIGGIVLSLFFLSPNLTGNAIANLTTKTSSIIGAGLFIVGLVGSYFWFKKK